MTAKFFWFTLLLLPAITGHAQTNTPANTPTDTQAIKKTGPPNITKTSLHSPVSLRSKTTRPNSFYISALGPGTAGSLNYELRFRSENHLGWGIRVGIGYAIPYQETVERRDTGGNYKSTTSRWPGKITIPFGFNCLIGKRSTSHRFEMGFGLTYVNGDAVLFDNVTTTHTWLLFATLYYRGYFNQGRFWWKAGAAPVLSLSDTDPMPVPWPEGAIGFTF